MADEDADEEKFELLQHRVTRAKELLSRTYKLREKAIGTSKLIKKIQAELRFLESVSNILHYTLGTRGNSLAKSSRTKAGKTSVRSEVSEASEGPNASSLWWRTPMVSLSLIQILYLITDWLIFKNVFLPATAVGQKRSREMNRFFQ